MPVDAAPMPALRGGPAAPGRPAPPVVPFVATGVGAALGAAPAMTASFMLQLGTRRGAASLALEARLDYPASTGAGSGSVSAGLILGSIVPCYHRGWLAACGVLGAGALRGAGHQLAAARSETSAFGVAGGRLTFEWPLGPRVALRAHAELLGRLRSVSLVVDGAGVWTTPAISGDLGLALAVRFP
jgi:hypothetical protein